MEKKPTKSRRKARAAERNVMGARSREFLASLPKLQSDLRRDSHLNWVSAIVGKFGVRTRRSANSRVSLIDVTGTKRSKSDVHLHRGPSRHTHQHNYFNVSQLNYNLLSGAKGASLLRQSQPAGSFAVATALQTSNSAAARLAQSRNLASAVPSTTRLAYKQDTSEGTWLGDHATSRLKKMSVLRSLHRAAVLEIVEESPLIDIVTHLARKHHRTEVSKAQVDREFGAPAHPVLTRSAMQAEEAIVAQSAQRMATESRAVEPSAEVHAPPPINVSQITDEVMKQLDRKLVAARERMGRI